MIYTVTRNRCDCHPETCACNPWCVVMSNGVKHSSFYSREIADKIAASLNDATTSAPSDTQMAKLGRYVTEFAKKGGWTPDEPEGAFEYIQRHSYACGLADAGRPSQFTNTAARWPVVLFEAASVPAPSNSDAEAAEILGYAIELSGGEIVGLTFTRAGAEKNLHEWCSGAIVPLCRAGAPLTISTWSKLNVRKHCPVQTPYGPAICTECVSRENAVRDEALEEAAQIFDAPVLAELLNRDVAEIIRARKGKPEAPVEAPIGKIVDVGEGFACIDLTAEVNIGDEVFAAPSSPAGIPTADEILSLLPSTYYMDPPDGGNVTVIEQLRRMAEDAAKYRARNA